MPVLYIFAGEILPDIGVGIVIFTKWFTSAIMIQTYSLLPWGNYGFLIYAALTIFGLIFIVVFIKETKDKTPIEIIKLYANPGDLHENLKDDSLPTDLTL